MIYFQNSAGLEIATDMVANATNIFSMATKNSGLVTTLETRFLYDLDLNKKSSWNKHFHFLLLRYRHQKNVPNRINKASLPPNLIDCVAA